LKIVFSIICIIGVIISNNRQNNLEQHIQCPCEKGMLINHASPHAMKLKKLISLLIQDSIDIDSVKTFVRTTRFINDEKNTQNDENLDFQICLNSNIDDNLSNNKISDNGIYRLIGSCYGEHLIKKDKNNSLIYFILFAIIVFGAIFSFVFISQNKKGKL